MYPITETFVMNSEVYCVTGITEGFTDFDGSTLYTCESMNSDHRCSITLESIETLVEESENAH